METSKDITALLQTANIDMTNFAQVMAVFNQLQTADMKARFSAPLSFEKEAFTDGSRKASYCMIMDFLAHGTDIKDSSQVTYRRGLESLFTYLQAEGKGNPVEDDLKAWVSTLSKEKGLKAATVQAYLIASKRFFHWTEKTGRYPNIATDVKAPKVDKYREAHTDVTADQLQAIRETVAGASLQDKRNYAIITLIGFCGLRDIEVSRALKQDYQQKGGRIFLTVHGKGQEEGGKTRRVQICSEVDKAVRSYLAERERKYGKVQPSEPLFAGIGNKNINGSLPAKSIGRIVKEAMQKADIGINDSRFSAHSLRHTFVTTALQNGADLKAVQMAAGHSRPETTLIYSHTVEESSNPVFNIVEKALQGRA